MAEVSDTRSDSAPSSPGGDNGASKRWGMNGYCVAPGCLVFATAADGRCDKHGHRQKALRAGEVLRLQAEAHRLDPALYGPLKRRADCPYCLPESR